ncbi:hypothetical protein [Polyangium spumosum]|uniref:Dickkopf N-terminal cysteine-rich domain-containing protein n=1 Tax=Polyangium spumosum TaxID=889282 RepID=A0A6N7PJV4_9BACT|nr:hypothetical protein [Polyangium spumosum]MRG90384.1 hypothetical protein [Polyangium spumosum]
MKPKNLLYAGLGLVALAFSAGCGPDIAGVCEAQEACLGGNEADIDACIVAAEGQRETAIDIGCGDEFDTLAACTEPLLECTSVNSGQMCMDDGDCGGPAVCSNGLCSLKAYAIPEAQRDTCEAEQAAYSRCN